MSYIGNTVENQNYVPAIDYFNGDGSTVEFTLSRPVASVAAVQAVISNVPQNPGSAFTVSGSTITFTSAPPSGTNNIYVYYTSPNTQVIQPGQGTVGTVQIADSAVTTAKIADANVTQAKLAAGVAGNGPAFSAYCATTTQSIANATWTKVQYTSKEFDTASCFDNTTNYRFTPNVAGYYQITAATFYNTSLTNEVIIALYKNGSLARYLFDANCASTAQPYMISGTNIIYANGTTDYFEAYTFQGSGSAKSFNVTDGNGVRYVYFQGALVRAA